jgi:hypothetical protein
MTAGRAAGSTEPPPPQALAVIPKRRIIKIKTEAAHPLDGLILSPFPFLFASVGFISSVRITKALGSVKTRGAERILC